LLLQDSAGEAGGQFAAPIDQRRRGL